MINIDRLIKRMKSTEYKAEQINRFDRALINGPLRIVRLCDESGWECYDSAKRERSILKTVPARLIKTGHITTR